MSDRLTLPEREVFVEWVHDTLNHLYDTRYLNDHALADLLAGASQDGPQRSQSVRRALVDAIRTLRPAVGTPAQSPDWRAHRILELRYIEGLGPPEVMDQLAVSKSHYFREQARVVEAVAGVLWHRVSHRDGLATGVSATPPEAGSRVELAKAEVERLCSHAVWEEIDVAESLTALWPVVESLAAANGVDVRMDTLKPFPIVHGSRALLRQSLLNIVTYALDRAQGGSLRVAPVSVGAEAGLAVRARRPDSTRRATHHRQGVGLEIGRQLLAAMRGRMAVSEGEDDWEADILWQTTAGQTLLVVDDNREFVELIRRFLAGYNWQVLGADSGQAARRVLADRRVTAIILDVMMPEEDGWEVLRALRAEEATRDVTVIVCSVLNEPQLAQMLGASAYLPKPLSRQALLDALQVQDASPASAR